MFRLLLASPVIALLASEALEMIDIISRSHHHLERWNNFGACSTVAGASEQS
jgi:hypothetical protein